MIAPKVFPIFLAVGITRYIVQRTLADSHRNDTQSQNRHNQLDDTIIRYTEAIIKFQLSQSFSGFPIEINAVKSASYDCQ